MVFSLFIVGCVFFLAYWILGGSLVASVWFIQRMSIRKARFGCLFTISALVSAAGASYTGYILGERQIDACMVQAESLVDEISAVIGCGVISFGLMGIIWFFLLGALSMFALFVSKSWNNSWMDEDPDIDDNLDYYYKEV